MTIAKKPSIIKLTESIINKGGSSPLSDLPKKNKNFKVTLRLSSKMIDMIDNYLKKSISNKTRTCWIREAVEEKIRKEITKSDLI